MKMSKILKTAISAILSLAMLTSLIVIQNVSAETTDVAGAAASAEYGLNIAGYTDTFNDYYSFQSDSVPSAWTGENGLPSGSNLMYEHVSLGNGIEKFSYFTIEFPVEAGKSYDVSFYMANQQNTTYGLKIRYAYGSEKFGASTTSFGSYGIKRIYDNIEVSTIEPTKKVSQRITVPADATYTSMWLLIGLKNEDYNSTTAAKVWFDNFEIKKCYTVAATADEGGTVSGVPEDYALEGDSVTLTATANYNYQFAGWYNGETKVSDSTEYTFEVLEDVNLTAKFEASDNLIVNGDFENDLSNWTTDTAYKDKDFSAVTLTDEGITALEGSTKALKINTQTKWSFIYQDITVEKNSSYVISFWYYRSNSESYISCKAGKSLSAYTEKHINSGNTGTWVKREIGYKSGDSTNLALVFVAYAGVTYVDNIQVVKGVNITEASSNSALGSVTASDTAILKGDEVTYTATATAGGNFLGWKIGDSEELVTGATYTLVASKDITITAVFEAKLGNVNQDSAIDASDIAALRNSILGAADYTALGDMNENEQNDIRDLVMLYKTISN